MTEKAKKTPRKKKRGYDLESRPANKQRLRDYVKVDDWIVDFLKRAPMGFFGTRWDEQPFVHPMTFWYDEDKHCIYMHGALIGRRDANTKRHEKIAFCAAEMGKLLPSNKALEFSTQYRSVMAFGDIVEVTEKSEKAHCFYGLHKKYFTEMKVDKDYAPIEPIDIKRTKAYKIQITSWSGKESWDDYAEMTEDFEELDEKWHEQDRFPMSYGKMDVEK
ncbi:MAG: pyridoxamine 5'-phosphate oxidase family protein [Emcibacteraceae bacterium]|nr:pyridoxamine 5'-phosphate oxidase family protein [Emcibacteraceae bacterium]